MRQCVACQAWSCVLSALFVPEAALYVALVEAGCRLLVGSTFCSRPSIHPPYVSHGLGSKCDCVSPDSSGVAAW
jgi:hypothetical protein